MVAMAGFEMLHTPPPVASPRVVEAASQMVKVPDIAAGLAGTVTTEKEVDCEVDPQVLVTV